jgi:hypothetical protein
MKYIAVVQLKQHGGKWKLLADDLVSRLATGVKRTCELQVSRPGTRIPDSIVGRGTYLLCVVETTRLLAALAAGACISLAVLVEPRPPR